MENSAIKGGEVRRLMANVMKKFHFLALPLQDLVKAFVAWYA